MKNFTPSSRSNPCPICDRTKDGDCRSLEAGNIWLCHTWQDSGEPRNGYEYLRHSDRGAGWGVWVAEKPKKAERPAFTKPIDFIYRDRNGSPLVKVTRRDRQFYQSTWDGKQWVNGLTDEARKAVPVYRYREVREAIAQSQPVFFVEGEGVADALWSLGIAATTTLGGAKGYRNYGRYSDDLKSAEVILCPDRDTHGIAYMQEVQKDYPTAKWCRVYPKSPLWARLPEHSGLDAVDWIADGATAEDFMAAIEQPAEKPKKESKAAPDFHEVLDQVDLLEAAIADDSELAWTVQNFAFENQLSSRGFSGSKLLQFAHARRDGSAAIERIDAHDILNQYAKPDFLIGGLYLRGTTVMLAAAGGSGKTTLMYDHAKAIATGRPWSGYRVKQGRCLMVQTDEPKPNIAQKLRVAKFRDVPRGSVEFVTKWRFTQFRQLERIVKDEGFDFVMIDSWTAAHAGTGIDLTKSSAGDNAYLLRNLAEDTGAVIVVIHHLNKLGEFRDSTTLKDNVSDAWLMREGTREENLSPSQRVLIIDKSRADLKGQYLLEQNALDYSWRHLGLLAAVDDPTEIPLFVQIQDLIESHPDKQFSAAAIAAQFGCRTERADVELQRLYRQGVIDCEWVKHVSYGREQGYFEYFVPGSQRPIEPHLTVSASGLIEQEF